MHQGDELLKINKALEMSEKRYRNILDNLQDAYIRADKSGIIIMANPSAARMYGYDSPEDMNGSRALSYYKNPEDRTYVLGELRKYGKVENNEVEALRKDGTSFFASQNAKFYNNENGKVRGTETLVRDITQRKKAEEALQRNEAEISFLLELNDALRQIDDPIQIQETTSRLLGEHLQADRVFYSEIVVKDDIEILIIENDYHRPGVSSLTGQFVFKEFSQTDYEDYRAGRTVSSPNVFTDEREPNQREAYRKVDVSAFIGVQLIKSGELVSVMGVLRGSHGTGHWRR